MSAIVLEVPAAVTGSVGPSVVRAHVTLLEAPDATAGQLSAWVADVVAEMPGPYTVEVVDVTKRTLGAGGAMVVDVQSHDAHRLHARLVEVSGVKPTYATFRPHVTLGYEGEAYDAKPVAGAHEGTLCVWNGDSIRPDAPLVRLGVVRLSGLAVESPPDDAAGRGRTFRVLSAGDVYLRSGERYVSYSEADIAAIAAATQAEIDGGRLAVPVDWNHASSSVDATPELGGALGTVRRVYAADVGDGRGVGLYVEPHWTERGAQVVAHHRLTGGSLSTLYSSPEMAHAAHDAADGHHVGALMVALALTTRPAQRADRVDPVLLSQRPGGEMDEDKDKRDPEAALADGAVVVPADEAREALVAERDAAKAEAADLREELDALKQQLAGLVSVALPEAPATELAQTGPVAMLSTAHAALTREVSALKGRIDAAQRATREAEGAREFDALMQAGVKPAHRKVFLSAYVANDERAKETLGLIRSLVDPSNAPGVRLSVSGSQPEAPMDRKAKQHKVSERARALMAAQPGMSLADATVQAWEGIR